MYICYILRSATLANLGTYGRFRNAKYNYLQLHFANKMNTSRSHHILHSNNCQVILLEVLPCAHKEDHALLLILHE